MWSALRSDLREFVNTVTSDTSNVLSRIDSDLDKADSITPAQQEVLRRMKLIETYTAPLEQQQQQQQEESNNDNNNDDDDEDNQSLQEYLQSFSIETKTEEIATLLEENPDTLQKYFETLVPTELSYQEFWKRYFYRCDQERIEREWEAQEEQEQARARALAVSASIDSVRNLLGGAVHAVQAGLTELDREDDSEPQQHRLPLVFGSKGRPPFVMNTAVSEDDEDEREEQEEDDEELGWDDDDDDEEEEMSDEEVHRGENEAEESVEQIEFKDAATEMLQEQLKQAIEERDQLQQTVEMQAAEIANLRITGSTPEHDAPAKEIDTLKMQLFEKESELAAIRENLLDNSRLDHADTTTSKDELTQEINKLTQSLTAKEVELTEMQTLLQSTLDQLKKMTTDLEMRNVEIETLKAAKAELESKINLMETDTSAESSKMDADLQAKINTLSDELDALKAENASLKGNVEVANNEKEAKIASLEAELSASKGEVASTKKQLSDSRALCKAAEHRAAALQKELTASKHALQSKEDIVAQLEEELTTQSHESPDTVSTGVKIESPAVAKLSNADDEDDWGDDWGDEEDV